MKTVREQIALERRPNGQPSQAEWRERAGRLYAEFERQARAMVRRAFRGAFSETELDDIYSGAWLGTLRALDGRAARMSDDEIRKYLLTAVANQAAKELRRRKRKPTAPLELVESVRDNGDTPEEHAAAREQSRVTKDLLLSLPPRRRAVMLLRYGWGLEPAQVCDLVSGLSLRAYRKEITRGVDELAQRMRSIEAGTWCQEREPLLKSMVAGVATADENRQARAHLAHCRECSEFVSGLRSNLHELGGALMVPGASGPVADQLAIGGGSAFERLRDAAGGLAARGEPRAAEELATRTATAGGAKGSGAAGAGVLAKLAGLGTAGKVTAACLTGGAAATACIAAGVGPIAAVERSADRPSARSESRPAAARSESAPAGQTLPSQIGNEYAPPPQPPAPAEPAAGGQAPAPSAPAPEPVEEVVAPTAPPVEQEFGVAAAAAPVDATSSSSEPTAQDTSPDPVQQEFGP